MNRPGIWPTMPPGHIEPFVAFGNDPAEMPGIRQIVLTEKDGQLWRAELFDDLEPSSLPIGGGDGITLAHALAVAVIDHNQKLAGQ